MNEENGTGELTLPVTVNITLNEGGKSVVPCTTFRRGQLVPTNKFLRCFAVCLGLSVTLSEVVLADEQKPIAGGAVSPQPTPAVGGVVTPTPILPSSIAPPASNTPIAGMVLGNCAPILYDPCGPSYYPSLTPFIPTPTPFIPTPTPFIPTPTPFGGGQLNLFPGGGMDVPSLQGNLQGGGGVVTDRASLMANAQGGGGVYTTTRTIRPGLINNHCNPQPRGLCGVLFAAGLFGRCR